MGLDSNGTKFLLYAGREGVSFSRTAMIGRQTLDLDTSKLLRNLRQFGYAASETDARQILSDSDGFAETFLRLLGAEKIESFDASDYEKATCVHDFNQPIAQEFKEKFSVVLDGGTLEHIFNFPTAIKNCMEMVCEDGHFLSITPTNNFLGHGFYQFSPELFFRIFTKKNGFDLRQVIIFEDFAGSNWYEVADPNRVRARVTLINKKPTYLLVIAKRVKIMPIFEQAPQQSDYFALWQSDEENEKRSDGAKPATGFFRRLTRNAVSLLRLLKYRHEQSRGAIDRQALYFKKLGGGGKINEKFDKKRD